MGGSWNGCTPNWMVYNGRSYLKWMIWGYPHLWKPPHELQGLTLVASFVAYGQSWMSRVTNSSDRKKLSWRRCSLVFDVSIYSTIHVFLPFPRNHSEIHFGINHDVAHTWAPTRQDKVNVVSDHNLQKWAKIWVDLINLYSGLMWLDTGAPPLLLFVGI